MKRKKDVMTKQDIIAAVILSPFAIAIIYVGVLANGF